MHLLNCPNSSPVPFTPGLGLNMLIVSDLTESPFLLLRTHDFITRGLVPQWLNLPSEFEPSTRAGTAGLQSPGSLSPLQGQARSYSS